MGNSPQMPKLVYVVTEDWYFVSHRLALAKAAQAAGYKVSVITRVNRHAAPIHDAGIALYPISFDRSGMNPFSEIGTIAKLTRLYRKIEPDLVHHVAMKPSLYGSWAARRAGVPAVVNALMGLGYVFSSEEKRARRLRPIVRTAFKTAMRHSNSRVIVQNTDDAALLQNQGLATESIIRMIVGSGINLEQFPFSLEPAGRTRVVLPARLLRDKGVLEFIDAARRLKAEGSLAEFVLAGAPDSSNPTSVTEAMIAGWVSEGLVTYLRWSEDMLSVLSDATIVCLPSYREGLPKVLLEAAACGRAIVTTDVPGCREIIWNGVNGWVVAPRSGAALADGLREAIAKPSLRLIYARAGRKTVEEHYSHETINRQTIGVYGEIVERAHDPKVRGFT